MTQPLFLPNAILQQLIKILSKEVEIMIIIRAPLAGRPAYKGARARSTLLTALISLVLVLSQAPE